MPFLNASSMQPAYSLRSPIDYLDDNFRFFLLLFNIVTVIIVYFFHNIHMYWSTKSLNAKFPSISCRWDFPIPISNILLHPSLFVPPNTSHCYSLFQYFLCLVQFGLRISHQVCFVWSCLTVDAGESLI